jgi:hypothetical protein
MTQQELALLERLREFLRTTRIYNVFGYSGRHMEIAHALQLEIDRIIEQQVADPAGGNPGITGDASGARSMTRRCRRDRARNL